MRAIATVCVALAAWVMLGPAAAAAKRKTARKLPSAAQLLARKGTVARETKALQEKLRRTKREQARTREALRQTNAQLTATSLKVEAIEDDMEIVRRRLEVARGMLSVVERALQAHTRALSSRLRLLYTRGHVDMVEVVAGSVGFADFANRLYFLEQVAHQDLRLLEQAREERRKRDEYKRSVEADERELRELHGMWEQKRQEFADQQSEQRVLLKRLGQERAAYESQVAANERTSREINAMLLRYHRYSPGGRARVFKRWGGSLRMPVTGPITSGFGWRTHPIYGVRRFHSGVDIGAAVGTPIRAAADGIVVYSGWWGAYGNCVIVDHGSGITTVYAHCQGLLVGRGQKVSAGHAIATVGSTGLCTGPHLHFELRRQGTPVSPW